MNNNFKFLKGKKMKHPVLDIELEYLEKSDAVCIIIFSNDLKKVLLVEQFRPGADDNTFENVAGLIDENENPDFAVFRELSEETGYKYEDLENILKLDLPLLTSPGISTEKLYFYAAKLKSGNILPGNVNFDIGEDIKSHWINVEDVLKYKIDLKTLFSINYFYHMYKN